MQHGQINLLFPAGRSCVAAAPLLSAALLLVSATLLLIAGTFLPIVAALFIIPVNFALPDILNAFPLPLRDDFHGKAKEAGFEKALHGTI